MSDFCSMTMSAAMQVTASFENRLEPPTGLETLAVTQAEIVLTWTDNALSETGFEVERRPDGSASWARVGGSDVDVSGFSSTDLVPGATYHFRVRACEETVCGGFSNVASGTTYPPLSSVSGGYWHTCGITPTGEAYCWGMGGDGKLGTGDKTWRVIPTPVLGGLSFSSTSQGYYHSCGVTTDGKGYCWGNGHNGALGIGEVDDSFDALTPTPVSGGLSFKSIGTGFRFTCGLTEEGRAFCWGDGDHGRLGTGGFDAQYSPAPVVGGLSFESISVGGSHTCGLTGNGKAWCWGSGSSYKLGNGSPDAQASPVAVVGAPAFASIHSGGGHTCGLTATGKAYCWGSGDEGQLGDGSMASHQATPVPVVGGLTFQSIGLGSRHTCGLSVSGEMHCWGYGGWGALGNGSDAGVGTPVPVEGGLAFSSIGLGMYHSCAVTTVGQAFCWGRDITEQLGNGYEDDNQFSPVPTVWFLR